MLVWVCVHTKIIYDNLPDRTPPPQLNHNFRFIIQNFIVNLVVKECFALLVLEKFTMCSMLDWSGGL